MPHILVVESSSPEIAATRRKQGRSAPQNFERVFSSAIPDVKIRVREPYVTDLTKYDLDGIDGIVMTGAGDDWIAGDAKAAPIRAACDLALASGLPTLGVCYGLQIGVLVLGGKVIGSPNGKEIGVAAKIELTDHGKEHDLMAARRNGFAVACAHRDEVSEMPTGSRLLAYNGHSRVQAMAYQRDGVDFCGVQYHPELSPTIIGRAMRENGSMFADGRVSIDDLHKVEEDPLAASRLGCDTTDFVVETRTLELTNWVRYVQRKSKVAA